MRSMSILGAEGLKEALKRACFKFLNITDAVKYLMPYFLDNEHHPPQSMSGFYKFRKVVVA